MRRALVRAALLTKDPRFQLWVWGLPSVEAIVAEVTAQYLRERCCAGESRRLIAEDQTCYEAFINLETTYLINTNQMAEPR